MGEGWKDNGMAFDVNLVTRCFVCNVIIRFRCSDLKMVVREESLEELLAVLPLRSPTWEFTIPTQGRLSFQAFYFILEPALGKKLVLKLLLTVSSGNIDKSMVNDNFLLFKKMINGAGEPLLG